MAKSHSTTVISKAVSSVVDDLKRQHDHVQQEKQRGEDAFTLVSPDRGMKGGGEGHCQLSESGKEINAEFDRQS